MVSVELEWVATIVVWLDVVAGQDWEGHVADWRATAVTFARVVWLFADVGGARNGDRGSCGSVICTCCG
jgi:hypothetical protein